MHNLKTISSLDVNDENKLNVLFVLFSREDYSLSECMEQHLYMQSYVKYNFKVIL